MDLAVAAPSPKSPEEIFPLEVWALILDNLECASDLENCYRTCQAWKELLQPKGATFLMREVFPILQNYLKNEYTRNWRKLKEEPPCAFLKMRLVSRSWKEAVDDYYQNHPSLGIRYLEQERTNFERFPPDYYKFDAVNAHKLVSFLDKNFPSDSNPFMARHLKYSTKDADRILSMNWNAGRLRFIAPNFEKLLESFGSQIWNCNLELTTRGGCSALYKLLRRYLSLMPNLKTLVLKVDFWIAPKEDPLKHKMLLQNEPFPDLNQLTGLDMENVPYPLSVGLLAQNKQLRKLSIQDDISRHFYPNHITNVKITQIEHLVVHSSSPYSIELAQLQKLTWPLKTLELGTDEKLKDVFRAVSVPRFSKTLEYLFLSHDYSSLEDKGLQKLRLKLPKLRKLKLKTSLKLKTIDFLATCTALEEVELFIGISFGDHEKNDKLQLLKYNTRSTSLYRNEDAAGSVIQFYSCLTCMQKSNIWQVLPMLQSINIETRSDYPYITRKFRYTRRQHEKYCRK